MICGEVLYENENAMAACIVEYGTEHSHNDHTISGAIKAGLARQLRENENLFCADGKHGRPCPGPCTTCWTEECYPTIVEEAIPAHF